MVTMHPFSSSSCSNWGMAVISLDFSSVFTWPRVSLLAEAQALTRWTARLPDAPSPVVSWERRTVFPNGHHLPRQQVGHRLGPLHEAPLELLWVQPGEDIAKEPALAKAGVSWEGMP